MTITNLEPTRHKEVSDKQHNWFQELELKLQILKDLQRTWKIFAETGNLKKHESLIEKVISSIDSDRFLTQKDIAGFDVSEVARRGYIFNPKCWECGSKIEVDSSDPKEGYVVRKFKHSTKGERKETYLHERCLGSVHKREGQEFKKKIGREIKLFPEYVDNKKDRYFTLPLSEALKYTTKIKNNDVEVKCKECNKNVVKRYFHLHYNTHLKNKT